MFLAIHCRQNVLNGGSSGRYSRNQRRKWRLELEPLEDRRLLAVSAFRAVDGSNNNLLHADWGSTDEQLRRVAAAAYSGNGTSDPAGTNRPSAREISNALSTHSE